MTTEDRHPKVQISVEAVETWIEAGWILPKDSSGSSLSEIDLARAKLIDDLKHGLGVNDEGIPLILDLLDQLHGLRRVLKAMLERNRA